MIKLAVAESELRIRDRMDKEFARRGDVEALYRRVETVEQRKQLSESEVEHIARESVQDAKQETSNASGALIRVSAFAISVAAFLFTLFQSRPHG